MTEEKKLIKMQIHLGIFQIFMWMFFAMVYLPLAVFFAACFLLVTFGLEELDKKFVFFTMTLPLFISWTIISLFLV